MGAKPGVAGGGGVGVAAGTEGFGSEGSGTVGSGTVGSGAARSGSAEAVGGASSPRWPSPNDLALSCALSAPFWIASEAF